MKNIVIKLITVSLYNYQKAFIYVIFLLIMIFQVDSILIFLKD